MAYVLNFDKVDMHATMIVYVVEYALHHTLEALCHATILLLYNVESCDDWRIVRAGNCSPVVITEVIGILLFLSDCWFLLSSYVPPMYHQHVFISN